MLKFVTIERQDYLPTNIKIIGVGGGGCNAIEKMIDNGLKGVEYISINTDAHVLEKSRAHRKLQIGKNLTRGLGSGADPDIGRKAIEENKIEILEVLKNSDLVFLVAGMGGGTGSGATPIISELAKNCGALVVGIINIPFRWEGKKRLFNAIEATNQLRNFVDSLIVIENEKLINLLDKSISASSAFDKPNDAISEATRSIAEMIISNLTKGITEIITIPGIINVDFADLRSILKNSGDAAFGYGIACGENRTTEAAQKALSSPLLKGIDIKNAKNILLNVTGSNNLYMQEIDEGNRIIYDAAGEDANIIFAWVNKEEMNEYVSYTVIVTGFHSSSKLEKKENKIPLAGFSQKKFEINENDELNVPTIFRVKGANKKMSDDEEAEQTSFRFDEFDAFEKEEIEEIENIKRVTQKKYIAENLKVIKSEKDTGSSIENSDSHDEDDSSSFLRMMMD